MRITLVGGVAALSILALLAQDAAPGQPIPFSHRMHVKMGLACKGCHPMPDPGEFATIPETAKCMECHREIKKESPAIQKLAQFHDSGTAVPWRRVYRIPDYVFFSHRVHVEQGATCQTCHGPVETMDVMRKVKQTSMAACMDCHRERRASLACNYCHDTR